MENEQDNVPEKPLRDVWVIRKCGSLFKFWNLPDWTDFKNATIYENTDPRWLMLGDDQIDGEFVRWDVAKDFHPDDATFDDPQQIAAGKPVENKMADILSPLTAAMRGSAELTALAKLATFGHRLIYWVGHAFRDVVRLENPEQLANFNDIDVIRGMLHMSHLASDNLAWSADVLRERLPDVEQFLNLWVEADDLTDDEKERLISEREELTNG